MSDNTNCTHAVLPLSAPIAQRCEHCDKLRPLEPVSFGEGLVLTGDTVVPESEYRRNLEAWA